MYQALYRKWRPHTFSDVVGQQHITTTLLNQVTAGKPSHAYLFCGSRGTGKTTCSKILAKAVNCPDMQGGNPCCVCDICKGIDNDSILDVTEIDAASNSSVENIRELREEANFLPVQTKYRVYIIDEAHMLSISAFNALLKIMEEPPPHVLFILATTETHKVPTTILSRCQRFDFKRIDSGTISKHLISIANKEKISLQPDAALLIAKLSDGGMRDALSLLDLCRVSGNDVTVESVRESSGLVGQDYLFEIVQPLLAGDSSAALEVLERLWVQSIDYLRLCHQLIEFFRNVMVAKSVANPIELIACTPQELEQYKDIAKKQSMPYILNALTVLQDTLARMSRTQARRTELEMGLLRLSSPELEQSFSSIVSRVEKLERDSKSKLTTPNITVQAPAKQQTLPSPTAEEIKKTPVLPFERWPEVIAVLKEKNKALHGALICSNAYTGGGILLVDAGEDTMFANMMRGDSYAKESLKSAVLEVTGESFRLGPYNAKKYEVEKSGHDKLADILKQATEMGAGVQVK